VHWARLARLTTSREVASGTRRRPDRDAKQHKAE